MHHPVFPSLPELPPSRFQRQHSPAEAVVYRGLAAHWPAVRNWSFAQLAQRVPDAEVQLVKGNREAEATAFQASKLRQYLLGLHTGARHDGRLAYLKEFDLLAAHPALRSDLRHHELLRATAVRSLRTWIGPAGAATGLHFDHLDNVAVQVIGTKRWRLARPGVVQQLGAVSSKYDAWAVLARADVHTLAERQGSTRGFFEVELHAGDVLYVPAGWWHEVVNVSATLMFGGFHGGVAQVLPRWLSVCGREMLHRAGWLSHGHCTCHPARGGATTPLDRPLVPSESNTGLAPVRGQ